MTRLDPETISTINTALYFMSNEPYKKPEMRPWQYVVAEYGRTGLTPPGMTPDFRTAENAQLWMCLDARYNEKLRAEGVPAAV